jgi:polyhydroxyalkanoate synthesis regulator phasin
MAQNDLLKRYLDAGAAFTAMTQARAEAIVKDLVKAGEVQTDQAQKVMSDLMERSRKNSDRLLETIRKEVRAQIKSLDIPTRDDLERLVRRLTPGGAPAKKATGARKTAAKKATTAKKAAKRATKKAAAKKSVS